jgi:hypothetical protein
MEVKINILFLLEIKFKIKKFVLALEIIAHKLIILKTEKIL